MKDIIRNVLMSSYFNKMSKLNDEIELWTSSDYKRALIIKDYEDSVKVIAVNTGRSWYIEGSDEGYIESRTKQIIDEASDVIADIF